MNKLLVALMGLVILAGCASNPAQQDRLEAYVRQTDTYQQQMAAALTSCESDLCRVVVARDLAENSPTMPQPRIHPAWGIVDRVIGAAVPIAGNYLSGMQWRKAMRDVTGAMVNMDTADYSTNVGGNYGDTDNSTNIGDDYTGGDRTDQRGRRIDSDGNDYESGGDIRITSPGPIDESGDCRDGGDCSDNSENNEDVPLP